MKLSAPTVLLACALSLTGCPAEKGSEAGHGHAHEKSGDSHDHAGHNDGASDGVIARITLASTNEKVGYLRLKLHDDKGDLEVWLARDADFAQPFDLPLDSTITVTFPDKENRAVSLRARNRDKNEDEEGKANVREGKTNYFIFPGATGADAGWLKGGDFLSTVKVAFSAGEKNYATSLFVLRPHTHGAGHAH